LRRTPRKIGRQGVEQAVAALEAKPVEEEITTPLTVATKDNLTEPEVESALYLGQC
jgi:ribose transport system substrate-binding protein